MPGAPVVIAHRTLPRHAPENSLEGIRCAAELGADAVELDVRMTRDRVPILMHDATPRRTTGGWLPVCLTSSARLRARRLANGEPVPTLAEALEALPPSLGVAIEVKARRAAGPTLAVVQSHGIGDRAWLWSEHMAVLRRSADHAPAIDTALLRDTRSTRGISRFLRDATACGARAVSPDWSVITPDLAARVRERGLRLYSWCQHEHPQPAKLELLDGLVTDWPAEARAIITR